MAAKAKDVLICIPDVLNGEQLAQLRTLYARQSFADGRESAGWAAADVKANQQVKETSPDYQSMQGIVAAALQQSSIFTLAAMPKVMRPILFIRYGKGMSYGDHVDNALMGRQPRVRTDLAFTLFISPMEEYEGGELEIDEPGGVRSFKLPAGALVLYPANSLHRVTEVTSGPRDVAVGWLQSLVRDHEQRRIIFELETLKATLFAKSGKTAEFDVLARNVSNLWRLWSDP